MFLFLLNIQNKLGECLTVLQNVVIEVVTPTKKQLYLRRFHRCQQTSRTKLSKWRSGTVAGWGTVHTGGQQHTQQEATALGKLKNILQNEARFAYAMTLI